MTKGETIKLLRNKNNFTLEDVAAKLDVSRQTVHKYEAGIITNIPSDKIELLAQIFNVTPDHIMGWDKKQDAKTQPQLSQIKLEIIERIKSMSDARAESVFQMLNIMEQTIKQ